MNWYYTTEPTHTRVRVFMNGAKCGDLCFRNEEFEQIRLLQEKLQKVATIDATYRNEQLVPPVINFINSTK